MLCTPLTAPGTRRMAQHLRKRITVEHEVGAPGVQKDDAMSFERLTEQLYAKLPDVHYTDEAIAQMLVGKAQQEVELLFAYYPGNEEQTKACIAVREAFKSAALAMATHCPHNHDRAAAIRKIREGLQMAIASIVIPPSP